MDLSSNRNVLTPAKATVFAIRRVTWWQALAALLVGAAVVVLGGNAGGWGW